MLCSGFLDKRSPKKLMGVSAWQTRWFELTPTALTYWEPMEAGIEAAKRKEGDLDSLKKPVYRGCIELSEMVGVRVDSKNEMRFELLMKSKRLFQLSAMDAAERQKWADALRQAQLDVLSASAGAVTLAAPTEEVEHLEEGADAVDGVGEGFVTACAARRRRARRACRRRPATWRSSVERIHAGTVLRRVVPCACRLPSDVEGLCTYAGAHAHFPSGSGT